MLNEPVSVVTLLALTIGVLQVIKTTTDLPKKLEPITSVAVAIILNVLGNVLKITTIGLLGGVILNGVMIGLMACGLYDQKDIATK